MSERFAVFTGHDLDPAPLIATALHRSISAGMTPTEEAPIVAEHVTNDGWKLTVIGTECEDRPRPKRQKSKASPGHIPQGHRVIEKRKTAGAA